MNKLIELIYFALFIFLSTFIGSYSAVYFHDLDVIKASDTAVHTLSIKAGENLKMGDYVYLDMKSGGSVKKAAYSGIGYVLKDTKKWQTAEIIVRE